MTNESCLHIEDSESQKPWPQHEELAAAIIERAVRDYKSILQKGQQHQLDQSTKKSLILEKNSIEAFFYSDWFATLTDLEPDRLIGACKRLAHTRLHSCSVP